jgi:anti-sigma regulatory factor (Ser/Thr protein kinase)
MELHLSGDPADLLHLPPFMEAAAQHFHWPERMAWQWRLILEELLVNAQTHGLDPARPLWLLLRIEQSAQHSWVTLEDSARPFNPSQAPQPDLDAALEDRPIGGLGMYLVHSLTDSLHWEPRPEGGNRLRMSMRLG